jgi:hypothetical protein
MDNEMSTRLERLRVIIGQFAQRALDAGESHSLVESRHAEAEGIVADLAARSATVSYPDNEKAIREALLPVVYDPKGYRAALAALTAMREERERMRAALSELWGSLCPDCGPEDYASIAKHAIDASIGEPAAEQDTGTADDQIDPAVVEKMREYTDRTISTMDAINQALKAAKEGRSLG